MHRQPFRSRRPRSTAATVITLIAAALGWLLKDHLPRETRARPASAAVRTVAASLPGRCTKVFDGDTYEVQLAEGRRRIRVKGIDCPESAESEKALRQADQLDVTLPALLDAGRGIKAEARKLVDGRAVQVIAPGGRLEDDPYGRLLAYVEVDGQDIGAELIARGLAYARSEPHPRQAAYREANQRARREHRGIYARLVR